MPKAPKPAIAGGRFFRALWRLGRIYWSSPDAKWGALLLALAILFELGTVYGNVRLADAERAVLDALERKQAASFFAATGLFLAVMLGFVLVSTYRIYVRQALEIRWRRGLTDHYLERWVSGQAYCQAKLHGDEVDNPDQRIAEDVREFVASALGLSLSLLSALVTLLSGQSALPVIQANCDYKLGARYDDELEIRTRGTLVSPVRLEFDYEIVRTSDEAIVAVGKTTHATLGPNGRPVRVPPRVKELLQ